MSIEAKAAEHNKSEKPIPAETHLDRFFKKPPLFERFQNHHR
jgi:hypothetical protein